MPEPTAEELEVLQREADEYYNCEAHAPLIPVVLLCWSYVRFTHEDVAMCPFARTEHVLTFALDSFSSLSTKSLHAGEHSDLHSRKPGAGVRLG